MEELKVFYIKDNFTGIIFDDNSYESLKNAVLRITEKNEVERMKRNITKDSKKAISMSNFYEIFFRMLNE